MSLIRGVRSSLFAGVAASGAWGAMSLATGASFGLAPMLAGIASGLGMAVTNEARDGNKAGNWAAFSGVVSSVGVFMGLSLAKGNQAASTNPFQAVVEMGALGVMSLTVGACAAWFLGGRRTLLSHAISKRPMVRRVGVALEGHLGALSRDVDLQKIDQERKAA